MIRTKGPGPGNGWRQTISSGRPSSVQTCDTSSVNSRRSGSTASEVMSSGSRDVVWLLILAALAVPDSDDVGVKGPARGTWRPDPPAVASKMRMNS